MNKIILFTKIPDNNFGKTRLRKFLSNNVVNDISKKLIYYVYNQIKKYPHCIYYIGDISKLNYINCQVYKQVGNNIGEKMFNAIKDEIKENNKVLLLGSDFAYLPKTIFDDAFNKLDEYDVVITPTKDLGYGLIGMKKCHDIFTDINYNAESVLNELIKKIEELNLTYTLLSELSDIDEIEDIIKFETNSENCSLIGMGEYNINFLVDNKIFRINTASQLNLDKKQIEYEFLSLKALENSEVTPKVYSYSINSKLLPYGTLYMQYLKGRPLNYKTDLKLAAFLLSKIHNEPINSNHFISSTTPFKLMYEEFIHMYSKYKNWNSKDMYVCNYIDNFLNTIANMNLNEKVSNPCIINTELNNENFIIGEKSYVIDWEKPIIGDCEQDLAHFSVPTTTNWKTDTILTDYELNTFLTEYSKYRNFSMKKLKKYMIFNIVRGITWCSMAKVEYSENKNIKNNETLKKINKFLSKEFLSMLESRFINNV